MVNYFLPVAHLQHGVNRVVILDIDLHHGRIMPLDLHYRSLDFSC